MTSSVSERVACGNSSHSLSPRPATVSLLSQLDWATGCPDLLVKRYPGCFWVSLPLETVVRIKQIGLPKVGGSHPISGRPEQKKADEGGSPIP